MAEPTLGQHLAAFAADTSAATLPDEVVASVRARVLDVLGLCVAAQPLPTSQAALAYVAEQGGRGQATAVGVDEKVPAALAAFANGVLAHSLDYDDTHLPSVLHPSATVVPAALAAAEMSGASGQETVAAIAVGLEACVRLGMAGYDPAAGNSVFFEHGQHATSICGTLGGAVAAARLLKLDAGGTLDALGVSASMAAGLIESNRNGGTVKRIHCGWAAHAAVSAAQLARHGVTGPPTVLEGRFGFFQAFLRGEFDGDEIVRGLGYRVGGSRHLLQAVPGEPLHPRRHRRRRSRCASAGCRWTRSSRSRSACPRRRCAPSASRSSASALRRPATRRSSAARTRSPPAWSAAAVSAWSWPTSPTPWRTTRSGGR